MRACPSRSSAGVFISTPMRRMRSPCCASAASGQAAPEPTIPLMKSRRRNCLPPRTKECADCYSQGRDYSRDLRPAEWGSEVRLHGSNFEPPMSALGQKRTSEQIGVMSALPPKADIDRVCRDVRLVPKADIQAAFGYYCWWARVLKFVEHHP